MANAGTYAIELNGLHIASLDLALRAPYGIEDGRYGMIPRSAVMNLRVRLNPTGRAWLSALRAEWLAREEEQIVAIQSVAPADELLGWLMVMREAGFSGVYRAICEGVTLAEWRAGVRSHGAYWTPTRYRGMVRRLQRTGALPVHHRSRYRRRRKGRPK